MSFFNSDWLKTVIPIIRFNDPSIINQQTLIEYLKNHTQYYPNNEIIGTASLINHNNFNVIVTNKHVLDETGYNFGIILRDVNRNNAPTIFHYSSILDKFNVEWVIDESNDLAVSTFITPAEFKFDNKFITSDLFCSKSLLSEGWDIFFVGYPVKQASKKLFPVVRRGMISAFDLPINNRILIDSYAAPGNSGGPCFLKPSPFTIGSAKNPPKKKPFIGIITETFTRTTYSQSGYSSNTLMAGLSYVISSDALLNLLNSIEYQNHMNLADKNLKKQ